MRPVRKHLGKGVAHAFFVASVVFRTFVYERPARDLRAVWVHSKQCNQTPTEVDSMVTQWSYGEDS